MLTLDLIPVNTRTLWGCRQHPSRDSQTYASKESNVRKSGSMDNASKTGHTRLTELKFCIRILGDAQKTISFYEWAFWGLPAINQSINQIP